jgi:hypothetical protein
MNERQGQSGGVEREKERNERRPGCLAQAMPSPGQ